MLFSSRTSTQPSTPAQTELKFVIIDEELPSTSVKDEVRPDPLSSPPPTLNDVPAEFEFVFDEAEDSSSYLNTGEMDIIPISLCTIAMECDKEKSNILRTQKKQKKERQQQSANVSNASNFEETVIEWLLDSDSDADFDESDGFGVLPALQTVELSNDLNLPPRLEQILQAEDSASDRVLQSMFPGDCLTFDWTNDKTTFKGRRETFHGTPGPTFDITANTTPTDIFEKMFDVEFIDLLCTETNRYADQKIASLIESKQITASSRLHRWTPTDRTEMISFLALMIIQGLYPLPSERMYFSFNGFGTMPYISKIMSANRCCLLKAMLHFIDNKSVTDQIMSSKLYKIQPIIEYFNKKFAELYYPQQEIAVDESLLKWRGRLSITQKIRTKAAKVGIKTYELCESSSGYLWRFSVYAGKQKTKANNDDGPNQTKQSTNTNDFRPTNATAKVVFDLVEPLLYRGHTLIMDNFYNSPLLARCLKRRQTDCYGTQRLNRDFVPNFLRNLTKTDLKHGEIVPAYCPDLFMMSWRDGNLVSMISTYHELQMGKCKKKDKPIALKPTIIFDYNKTMGGVDRKDQYLSAHPVDRVRNRVWYKKLFRRLFNCAVFNCFVIYSTKHKQLRHREFRTVLVENLLKTYRKIDLMTETRLTFRDRQTKMTPGRPVLKLKDRPIVENDHFPVHSSTKRGRCWWCSHKRRVSSRTVWKCMECNVNLCILNCFRDYHKP